MNDLLQFAYIQARLQSRHGQRPDEALWKYLQGIGDAGHYLYRAQEGALRLWVKGLHASQGSHVIERSLRQRFHSYIQEVADWLPGPWRGSIQLLKQIPDLPALQHLLFASSVQPWMKEDPCLSTLLDEQGVFLPAAVATSDYHWMPAGLAHEESLLTHWLHHWRQQWPRQAAFTTGMKFVAALYRRQIEALSDDPLSSGHQRQLMTLKLSGAFRRYSFQPAAVCAHLGLVALDVEKLRGDLVRRIWFPDSGKLYV
ncbi:MAG: hypothetical protein KZQ58_03960 [gamma proteobacterium symbiont of Bathyaustriella thionipta]|nr:hypothetical protein [gamma proteobacterium symbiont of Bathyaustriella thionipta]